MDSQTFRTYLAAYEAELLSGSPCAINLLVDYDSTSRFLNAKSRVTAVDTFSGAHLRYALAENHIHHHWQGKDSLHHVVRTMLPDYNGVPFELRPGEVFLDSQTCVLPPAWNDRNCYVVVFVQKDVSPNPVFRSAKSGLFEIPAWVPGDANADGVVDMVDLTFLLEYLYLHGLPPNPLPRGDPNSDCVVDVGDAVYLCNYFFRGGPQPLRGCAW